MMENMSKIYTANNDKKKKAPGQWLNQRDVKELISIYNFDWHKEESSYFFDEGLSVFYRCYLDPSIWKQLLFSKPENKTVEVIKEVNKPFDKTEYSKDLLKDLMKTEPDNVTSALKRLVKRNTSQLLSIFEVSSTTELIDCLSGLFVFKLLGHSIAGKDYVYDDNTYGWGEELLGMSKESNAHIYLSAGFRIKVAKGTEVSYC